MADYLVPYACGEDEFKEKQSRFIGHIWPTPTEEEALARIKETREKYWDARHNVYAYIIKDGPVRYSDDGEPKGTGGMPVLEILRHAELCSVCCVVTRYFGGVLLGTGGLTRAYSLGAKLALEKAGVAVMKTWTRVVIPCSYSQFERLKQEAEAAGGRVENTDFSAEVTISALIPTEDASGFIARLTEISAGTVKAREKGREVLPTKLGE